MSFHIVVYLLNTIIRAVELDFPTKFSTSQVYFPLCFLWDMWWSVIEFFLNSFFIFVNDLHFREFPPSQIPNSSSFLYHVILGLGLPLVLHFNVTEMPSLAITTGGKLRIDGFFGSTKWKIISFHENILSIMYHTCCMIKLIGWLALLFWISVFHAWSSVIQFTSYTDRNKFLKSLFVWLGDTLVSASVGLACIFDWQDKSAVVYARSTIGIIMIIIYYLGTVYNCQSFSWSNFIPFEFSFAQSTATYVGIILVLQRQTWWLDFYLEFVFK